MRFWEWKDKPFEKEFLLKLSKQYQVYKQWVWGKVSIKGILVDPIPNSLN